MSITAAPVLEVAGLTLGTGSGPELTTVGELRIGWGRASVLEPPTPATANVTVRDLSADAGFARRTDLIGQPVLLQWTGGGLTTTNFRGRITDVSVVPRRKNGRPAGFYVHLAASSAEVELGNYLAPAGTVWPAESFAVRLGRIRALAPATLVPAWVFVQFWGDFGSVPGVPNVLPDSMLAGEQDVSGRSVLDLVREVGASLHPTPLIYSPVDGSFGAAMRRRFTPRYLLGDPGPTLSAELVTSAEHGGRYVARSLGDVPSGGAGLALDAQKTGYAGELAQPLDSRITRVELSYLDSTAGYSPRTVTATTAAADLEDAIGRRVLSVSTVHATAANATALARLYADIAGREAAAPRLGALSYSTARTPFPDTSAAVLLLSGHERTGSAFLGRSWLTRLGQRPMFGFLGGTITYRRGEWDIALNPAPVVIDPAPVGWAPLTVAAAASSPAVRLRDIDRSVTFGDAGFLDVGAGFTRTTMPAYPGNPT